MVAERDHVDAGGEQLVGDLGGDAEPAGDVLAVDDDEVGRVGARAARAAAQQRAPAEPADEVTEEQDAVARAIRRSTPSAILQVCVDGPDCAGEPAEPEGEPIPKRSRRAARSGEEHDADSVAGRRRRRFRAAEAGPAGVAPVVVPRWVQLVVLPWRCWGCGRWPAPPGRCSLVVIVAALVALILGPVVRVLERRLPRGLAICASTSAASACWSGSACSLANPISNQIRRSSTTSRTSS